MDLTGLDPHLAEQRTQWERKPALRAVYADYHRHLLAHCRAGRTLEIGSGSGNIADFVDDVITLDILPAPWLDVQGDAQALPFAAASFDNIVMLDVLHHIEHPRKFLGEAARVLRPSGRLVMIEPGITPLSWIFFNFVHHEPVMMRRDPLGEAPPVQSGDPWDSNQAVPTQLFVRKRNRKRLEAMYPDLRVVEHQWLSLFAYPLSGGFRPWSLLPARAVSGVLRIERFLLPVLGPLMAFRLLVVVERRPAGFKGPG